MSDRPALDAPVRELLAAVVAALDLPLPSIDRADERAHHHLLEARALDVRVVLDVLTPSSSYPGVVENGAADIRRRIASTPIDYTPFVFREEGAS
ncbi:hypothetical protein [Streptomyces sp. NPDC092952]|uniref:hypothetical protein n=1 Tax=Streptomyces sp. NPDC092952 TaxID=3366018 RepID=UPI0037F2161D